ncbi:UNVERIFIED_CONTAM: hypothetical protein GTU68_042920, partial [Idotea baltica]|nr:hypothetical protein [Idotea baltica]
KIGIILGQLGTPNAPTAKALKPYLKEFLGDPRVIEKNRALWWVILNFIILKIRPKRSAKLYKRIWTEEGSPLLVYTKKQTELLREKFKDLSDIVEIEYGMRYGRDSIAEASQKLIDKGCSKILLFNIMCTETTRAMEKGLEIKPEEVIHTFQSRFGKDPWLVPYTDEKINELAESGVKKIAVFCPGFTTDCLETLDEIGNEAREDFIERGGESLELIPCLNDHPVWIEAMEEIIRDEIYSWVKTANNNKNFNCKIKCPVATEKAKCL